MTEDIQFGSGSEGRNETVARETPAHGAETDSDLERALAEFRSSVHAWSQAAYGQARIADNPIRRRGWRLAAGWALGCALIAGGVAGGILKHEQQLKAARTAPYAEQQAGQQQIVAAQNQAPPQDTGLMAKVESDTVQEVPDAMEPLAQLMEEGGYQ